MASVSISGDVSGAISIAAPSAAGSGVLTLPTGTDTLVGKATTDTLTNKTLGTGTVFPAGAVLQVVSATDATINSTTSASPSATTVTASITPKFATSKILVLMNVANVYNPITANTSTDLFIYRGVTRIMTFGSEIGYKAGTSAASLQNSSTVYLDSPATTSSTTYTLYFARNDSAGSTSINSGGGATSSITLMEIQG